jgi:hypothetical protein
MVYVRETREYSELIDRTYSLTKFTNPMHDEKYPLIDKMTAEVLAMSQSLFNGDASAFNAKDKKKLSGLVTDGGTSSIMEACSAYTIGFQPFSWRILHARHNTRYFQWKVSVLNASRYLILFCDQAFHFFHY